MPLALILMLLLTAGSASAEGLDPKLVEPTIGALQSMLKLRDVQLQVYAEQLEALRAKCGDPCKEGKDANPTSPSK